jgi:hypothetical protein
MDFFGILQYQDELATNSKQFSESDKGFGCQTEGCGNREAKSGSVFLPYCNDNLICAKKNVEHLVQQTLEQRGKISTYHTLISSILPESQKLPHNSIDFMDEGI